MMRFEIVYLHSLQFWQLDDRRVMMHDGWAHETPHMALDKLQSLLAVYSLCHQFVLRIPSIDKDTVLYFEHYKTAITG